MEKRQKNLSGTQYFNTAALYIEVHNQLLKDHISLYEELLSELKQLRVKEKEFLTAK